MKPKSPVALQPGVAGGCLSKRANERIAVSAKSHIIMKRVGTLGVAATVTSGCVIAALTASASAAHAKHHGKLSSIYFANPLPSYPEFAIASRCFLSETRKLGIKGGTGGPPGASVDNQFTLDGISQALADGYRAIVMVPIAPAEFTPAIKRARKHGVLVATLNTGNTTTAQNVELGTDYADQGRAIVAALSKRKGQQNVLVLGNQAGGPQGLFVHGIVSALKRYRNVHYLGQVFDGGNPSQTPSVVVSALEAHPTANMVVTWEGSSTQGVVTAIKESNDTGKVFGVVNDLTPESIAGLKGGQVYGISKQNFCGMATGAVKDLVAISEGKHVPRYINTGITFVTKSNLAAAQKTP